MKLEAGISTSLRDLMMDEPAPLTRPLPQPSPPQRQRSEHYSRIPTSTKEHYTTTLDKKVEIFSRKYCLFKIVHYIRIQINLIENNDFLFRNIWLTQISVNNFMKLT